MSTNLISMAIQDVSTVPTHDEGGRAPPVKEKDGLLAPRERIIYGSAKRPAENGAITGPQLLAQIDDLNRR